MAIIVEAINEVYSIKNSENVKLFLAGGISNCRDWQADLIKDIKNIPNLTVYNPRRKNFPIGDLNAAEQQITWEFNHLRDADIVTFWFSSGSLNPIVLYELGMWGNSCDRPIIVGIDPDYERKHDVEFQTRLSRPEVPIVYSLEEMSEKIYDLFRE